MVAVSGGADSVALLAVLRDLAGPWGLRLIVAHLNHGLRPDAAVDARFVERLAAAWNLPYVGESADVRAIARTQHLSLEAAAREARYAFLTRVAAAHDCPVVAVGHTADDQAETLLLRLLRGGRPGGMWPRRPRGAVAVIRPLLDCWRRDLRADLLRRGLPWRDDPTNVDTRHLRNRVRHDLIPVLAGYIRDVQNRLKHTADVLAADDAALEEAAAAAAPAVLVVDDAVRLQRDALLSQPAALRWRLARRAVQAAGGNIRRLRFVHLEEILRLVQGGTDGQRVSVPGVIAEVHGPAVVLGRPAEAASEEVVVPTPGQAEAGPFDLIVDSAVLPVEAADLADGAAYLDADRARPPLVLRAWRPGDRFRPLGMRGKKKVGDFLTDAKVPRLQRGRIAVLQGADGTILWLVGWRVAEDARVTEGTRRVLRLRARPRR